MPLTYDLFKNDALIFEHMNTNEISIRSHKHNKFVKVEFDGFPFVGVWTPGITHLSYVLNLGMASLMK